MFLSLISSQPIDCTIDNITEFLDHTAEGKVSPVPIARKNKFLLDISNKPTSPPFAQPKLTDFSSTIACKEKIVDKLSTSKEKSQFNLIPMQTLTKTGLGNITEVTPVYLNNLLNTGENRIKNIDKYLTGTTALDDVAIDDVYNGCEEIPNIADGGLKRLLSGRKHMLNARGNNHNLHTSTVLSFDMRLEDNSIHPPINMDNDYTYSDQHRQIDTLIDCEEILREHDELSRFVQSRKGLVDESSMSYFKNNNSRNFTSMSPNQTDRRKNSTSMSQNK